MSRNALGRPFRSVLGIDASSGDGVEGTDLPTDVAHEDCGHAVLLISQGEPSKPRVEVLLTAGESRNVVTSVKPPRATPGTSQRTGLVRSSGRSAVA